MRAGTRGAGTETGRGKAPSEIHAAGTVHRLYQADARSFPWIADESVHLVVTSPPYWTLKEYNAHPAQLGSVAEYDAFQDELDKVWRECHRVLVAGGRVVCVVGDVCIARRRNRGRHMVVPLHADISVRARRIGFDYLTPIFWHKIANASYEVENGSAFLGKPYEPNAILKNDVEYLLMLRKPGGYRKPTLEQRRRSKMTKEEYHRWFRSSWNDVPGASTREHPAPFPEELALRLIRMFSFVDDVVLDPFAGTFTTTVAAMKGGRSSVGIEVDPDYFKHGVHRVRAEARRSGGRLASTPRVDLPGENAGVRTVPHSSWPGDGADSEMQHVAFGVSCRPCRAVPGGMAGGIDDARGIHK